LQEKCEDKFLALKATVHCDCQSTETVGPLWLSVHCDCQSTVTVWCRRITPSLTRAPLKAMPLIYVCLSLCLSLSVCLTVCLTVRPSVCLSVCLLVFLLFIRL